MIDERILGIDASSKTGYAFGIVENGIFVLQEYGQIPKIECPTIPYPDSYVEWAYKCFYAIEKLIEQYQPTILSIEETCRGSKNALSQKLLEFIHFLLAKYISETHIDCNYLLTGEWRKLVDARMNDEEKKRNKYIKEYKKKNKVKLAKNENGKIVGQITKKHVNVRLANELFGLSLKIGENDTADAILLAFALYLKNKKIEEQKEVRI